jgi:hypothetical protein
MLLENIYGTSVSYVDSHLQLSHRYSTGTCGLHYRDITIVNDTIGLSVQVVASPTIIIQTTPEVSLRSFRTLMVQASLMSLIFTVVIIL